MPLRFHFVSKLRLTNVYLYDTLASEKGRQSYTSGGETMPINLSDSEWKLMNHLWE